MQAKTRMKESNDKQNYSMLLYHKMGEGGK